MRTLLHCCRYMIGLDSPATQVTEREAAILVRYAREAAVIVEIGTFEGKTASRSRNQRAALSSPSIRSSAAASACRTER